MLPKPPVLAFHIVVSTYGFWLPNDPRGSNSARVGTYHLRPFGPATHTSSTRSVAGAAHDRTARLAAKQSLQYDPVRFRGAHLDLVLAGFQEALDATGAGVHAGVIQPDHVHLILPRHHYDIERLVGQMKARASRTLRDAGHFLDPPRTHPDSATRTHDPRARPIWGAGMRTVFLFAPSDIDRCVRYVLHNPRKHALHEYRFLPARPPR
jgi:REP element-mobilizing transposase RayT